VSSSEEGNISVLPNVPWDELVYRLRHPEWTEDGKNAAYAELHYRFAAQEARVRELEAELGDFRDECEGWKRASGFRLAAESRVAVLEAALRDAIWAADYLADQQAMPDDGYVARLESARKALSVQDTEKEAEA